VDLAPRRQNQNVLHENDRLVVSVIAGIRGASGQHEVDTVARLQHPRKRIHLIYGNRDRSKSGTQTLGKVSCIRAGNRYGQQWLAGPDRQGQRRSNVRLKSLGGDSTARGQIARNLAHRHGLGTHGISALQVSPGNHNPHHCDIGLQAITFFR
jgi:hypothetical protein